MKNEGKKTAATSITLNASEAGLINKAIIKVFAQKLYNDPKKNAPSFSPSAGIFFFSARFVCMFVAPGAFRAVNIVQKC